jgi:hypothetical protein
MSVSLHNEGSRLGSHQDSLGRFDGHLRELSALREVLAGYTPDRVEHGPVSDEIRSKVERCLWSADGMDLVFSLELLLPYETWLREYSDLLPLLHAFVAPRFKAALKSAAENESNEAQS